MIVRPTIPPKINQLFPSAKTLIEGWKLIIENPKDIAVFVLVSILTLLIDALSMYFVFLAINSPIQYAEAIILSSLSFILSYINITPDGLGCDTSYPPRHFDVISKEQKEE